MNTSSNSRKKQIKPKVTIDHDIHGKDPKPKFGFMKRFLSKLNSKILVYLITFGAFVYLVYFLIPFFNGTSNIKLIDVKILNEQEAKITEIESQINNNNQLLLALQGKDDAIIDLERKIIELNNILNTISEKNIEITEQNNQLISMMNETKIPGSNQSPNLINNEEISLTDTKPVDDETFMPVDDSLISLDKNIVMDPVQDVPTSIEVSISENNKNIVELVIRRIEENIDLKIEFQDEIDILQNLGLDDLAVNKLIKLSYETVPSQEDLINELDRILESQVSLFEGDNGFKSRVFNYISGEISITRKSYIQNPNKIDEIKANIYNDDLLDVLISIDKIDLESDKSTLIDMIKVRKIYKDNMRELRDKFEIN